jgi:antitoxin VapB
MARAKVFRSGNSQAVRLPKQYRFKSKEVEIYRRGEEVVLRETRGNMARAYEIIANLPEDVLVRRKKKELPQERKGL